MSFNGALVHMNERGSRDLRQVCLKKAIFLEIFRRIISKLSSKRIKLKDWFSFLT